MVTAIALSMAALAAAPPEPVLPVPTPQQLAWQRMEYGMFCHFGINTFHDEEWTDGTKPAESFQPTGFDPVQWAETAKAAGMKYVVLTAKHHDGFAVYPTAHSGYSVKASPWMDGAGDALRGVADAVRAAGLMFGVYLSPWDRHEPKYADARAYDVHFAAMLREVLEGYGPVGEVWFDGAGTKGHVYDWAMYYKTVRQYAPDALIAIVGPDIRWVGNEDGLAPETLWNPQPYAPPAPYPGAKAPGEELRWWPAECDVPVREGQWFFHTDGERHLRSLDNLIDIYYRSVGHGAGLLLNVSPDRRGLLPEADAARLLELRAALDETFFVDHAPRAAVSASNVRGPDRAFMAFNANDNDPATYWATDDGVTDAWLELDLGLPTVFDRVLLQEHLPLGQRVAAHTIEVPEGDAWRAVAKGTTIGHKRIHRFPEVTASKVRVHIGDAKACPAIERIGIFKASPRDAAAFAAAAGGAKQE